MKRLMKHSRNVSIWLLAASVLPCFCQPLKTKIEDKLRDKYGHSANGKVLVHWNEFTAADGHVVQAGQLAVPLGSDGHLSVCLVPNVGATPIGSYYVVQFVLNDGTRFSEYWVVPKVDPSTSIPLSKVRNQVLPTKPMFGTTSSNVDHFFLPERDEMNIDSR